MILSSTFSSFLTIGIILGVIFILCAWAIKKAFIDKRWFNSSSRFVGMHVYTQWQNADRQEQIDHIHYIEEQETDEESQGEEK